MGVTAVISLRICFNTSISELSTHLGKWCTYTLINKATDVSDNGLSPVFGEPLTEPVLARLLIGPLEAHFSEIWIKQQFSYKKMHLPSVKWRPFCLYLNVHIRECGAEVGMLKWRQVWFGLIALHHLLPLFMKRCSTTHNIVVLHFLGACAAKHYACDLVVTKSRHMPICYPNDFWSDGGQQTCNSDMPHFV